MYGLYCIGKPLKNACNIVWEKSKTFQGLAALIRESDAARVLHSSCRLSKWPLFGSVTVHARNSSSSSGFSVRTVPAEKKKAYIALLQWGTFLCRKKGGHRGKISVVDMASPVFMGFWYPPLAWKVFL